MSTEALVSWVDYAVEVAMKSPCQSKRGVLIADKAGDLIGEGFNHQPSPFICDGSDACKRTCGKTAVHAEQSAILSARADVRSGWMLHVKARDGKPCASMAPSCLECSKLILESGISWMHLLHDTTAQILPGEKVVGVVEGWSVDGSIKELHISRYSAQHFHWLTAEYSHHRASLILPLPSVGAGGEA